MAEEDGWKEYQIHVLAELKRLNDCYGKLDNRMIRICNDISMLKVKAGVWGLLGGAIPIIVGFGIWMLRG